MTEKFRKIDDYRQEIPVGYKPGMRVHGIIYVDEKLLSIIEKDQSVEQVANAATLPGIVKASLAMPDIHEGYGFPIGGVVATDITKGGLISPGGVGYDINCGVRLVRSNLKREDVLPRIKELVQVLFNEIPTGVGSKGKIRLGKGAEERDALLKGSLWAVENGYGEGEDLEKTESGGCIDGADPDLVSNKAYERGRPQLGTLGSGNHFLEVQYVQEVYDERAANTMGLFKDQITVMIHSGSRGFGHQVCTDYLATMEQAIRKYGIELPDRQLAGAPYDTKEAQEYLSAMRAAANYAWANRQCLMHWTREVFQRFFGQSPKDLGMKLIYDVAHNIVKVEEHIVDGRKMKLAVHRKGATRAFPPGHPELPAIYRDIGQPVLIPGDMGRNSFLLLGTKRAMNETFGSTCHGAGRLMSRHQAIRSAKGRAIYRELEDMGIYVKVSGKESIKEEMPDAYKNIADVINVVHNAGISTRVVKLKPMGVIKG